MYFVKINESWYLHYLWLLDLSKGLFKWLCQYSSFLNIFSEAATWGFLWKKVFLEILQNSQENTCAGVFLWILRNFQEHLFTEHLWSTAFKYFFKRFCLVGKCEVILHCLYHDPLTLILWTYPFFISIFLSHEKVNRI